VTNVEPDERDAIAEDLPSPPLADDDGVADI